MPSAVTYDVSDPSKLINWGFPAIRRQAPGYGGRESEPFTRFRTLLQESRNMSKLYVEELGTLNRLLEAHGKNAKDITVDYLRCIWKYTAQQLKPNLGANFQEEYTVRVVLTIPALWTPSTTKMMKALAIRAGLPYHTALLLEPKAVAVATFKVAAVEARLETGDIVTICNAGGETCVSNNILFVEATAESMP